MLGIIIIVIANKGVLTVETANGKSTITIEDMNQQSAGSLPPSSDAANSTATKSASPPETSRPSAEPVADVRRPDTAPAAEKTAPMDEAKTPTIGASGAGLTSGTQVRPQKPAVETNSIGMKLAPILAGEFDMGSSDDDKDASLNEKPQHRVRISPFYMGVTEVTQAQYEAVMGTNPSGCASTGYHREACAGRSTSEHPVETVSWWDAIRFCNALSAKEGLTPYYETNGEKMEIPDRKGPGYRLPTEAEWEYACRARTTTRYFFGNDPSSLGKYAWFGEDERGPTHPVGGKVANDFGLCDMYGNVGEWCSDWFDAGHYLNSTRVDPLGPPASEWRVRRGGSHAHPAKECRSAWRSREDYNSCQGFRVVRGQPTQIKNQAETSRRGSSPPQESKTSLQASIEAKSVASAAERPKPNSREPEANLAQTPRGDWASPTSGMGFVRIKGGEFDMGSPDGDKEAFNTEKPPHQVRISPFYLGLTEVTQAQYQTVTGKNPSHFSAMGAGRDKVVGQASTRYPVENISWLDAVRFCNALSKRDGFAPYYRVDGEKVEIPDRKGSGYRLPTEAEWEYACRGGKTTRFSFGNDAPAVVEYGWLGGNSGGSPHPVAQKRPNDLGLYDMHGNVWEWCSDGWDEDYYKKAPEDDPTGASGAPNRVFRGGSWDSEPRECRSANRYRFAPENKSYFLGFRVALNLRDENQGSVRKSDARTTVAEGIENLTAVRRDERCRRANPATSC